MNKIFIKSIIRICAFLLFIALSILFSVEAKADLVPLNRIPLNGTWPTGCYGSNSAGQWIVVSKPPRTDPDRYLNFLDQNIQARPGQTIPLEVVFYTTTCKPYSQTTSYPVSTGNFVSSLSINNGAGISGLANDSIVYTNYNYNVLSIEATRIPINVTIPSNLASGVYAYQINVNGGQKINKALNNKGTALFACVESGGARGNYNNVLYYFGCKEGPAYLGFTVSVERPRPTTYDGTIQTNKRLADGTLLPWNGGAANPPFSSYVELINPNGGVFGGSNSNPSTTTPVWVKWDNHQSNEEGRWVSDRVAVPSGWRIKGVATSLEGQPLANDGLSCTGANNTGSCTVKGLTVRNGKATFVDWFYEKIPPKLELTCTSDTPATAGKITISASTNIPGDPTTATVLADYDKNPPTTQKTLTTGSDSFDVNKDYRDDAQHTYNVSYQGLTKSITFGPNVADKPPAQCNIKAWYYPWLQTKNGDVVANGKIIGQQSGDKRLGSRPAGEKEAQYLIIASFAGNTESGSNFCSIYNYILTNPNATKGNCTNGFGYTLNNNTLGNSNDDNVTKGVAQSYDAFPAQCKSNNPNDLAAINVSLSDCPDGKIYRIIGGDLPAINVRQGRATILVDGDVNINKTISYANVGGGNPKDQPNLAIVVKGSAKIFSNVDTINSLIYSTGEINTCQANSASFCNKPINVIGSLIAKNGFKFNRVFYSKETRGPAERITLNPVSILYPPPGISSEYFVGYNNGASIDAGEFQPRF